MKNLKVARLAKGLSQRDVGKILGISFQQIQKYENGSSILDCRKLIALCKLLDVSADELLGLEKTKFELTALQKFVAKIPQEKEKEIINVIRALLKAKYNIN